MKNIQTLNLKTSKYIEFVEITSDVREYIQKEALKEGIVIVYTPHTTAGITINENADPAVTLDIEEFIRRKIPHEGYFKHMEGNSPSHIMSSLFSASETFVVNNGQLLLGTWQAIYFCEFDGPRQRKVYLKIIES